MKNGPLTVGNAARIMTARDWRIDQKNIRNEKMKIEIPNDSELIPKGWELKDYHRLIFWNRVTGEHVQLGIPTSEEHNCDAMGCRYDHVIRKWTE
jgi:hypothetical protein